MLLGVLDRRCCRRPRKWQERLRGVHKESLEDTFVEFSSLSRLKRQRLSDASPPARAPVRRHNDSAFAGKYYAQGSTQVQLWFDLRILCRFTVYSTSQLRLFVNRFPFCYTVRALVATGPRALLLVLETTGYGHDPSLGPSRSAGAKRCSTLTTR